MNTIYQEYFLDLYRHPINKETPADFDITFRENNPACGDSIEIFLKMDKNTIKKMSWTGTSCAVSTVSASLLSDQVIGKDIAEIEKMGEKEILTLLKMDNLNPSRLRCAMLPLTALKKCLKK